MAIGGKKLPEAVATSSPDEFTPVKAERKLSKLRLAVDGASGSGKTYSSLLIASGLGKKIVVIDTENGSACLYPNICNYDVIRLNAPFTAARYIKAIKKAEELGYEVIIIDSFSHAWAGAGGMLEKQNVVAKRIGNSYTAWREVTPDHELLVETILQSNAHIIVTMRSKMAYVMETGTEGRTTVRKLGLSPVQRDGVEFEFTTVFDMTHDHVATSSKDRTGMFDGLAFKPDENTGKKFAEWLNGA